MLENIRWGLERCMVVAIGLSLLASAVLLLGGADRFEEIGVGFFTVIATYFVTGAIGGVVLGLLRPLTEWKAGAITAAILASVPLATGIALTMYGMPSTWRPSNWFSVFLVSLTFGVIYGRLLWEAVQESRAPPTTDP